LVKILGDAELHGLIVRWKLWKTHQCC